MMFLFPSSLILLILVMRVSGGVGGDTPPLQVPPVLEALEILRGNKQNSSWYPQLTEIPQGGGFSCDTVNQLGYYADGELGCQVIRYCGGDGTLTSYLCPVQTVFNQITLTCDWFYNVDCSRSVRFYDYSNARLYHADWQLLSDFSEDYYKQFVHVWARDNALIDSIAAAYESQGGVAATPIGTFLRLVLRIKFDHGIAAIPGLTAAQCVTENTIFMATVQTLLFYGNATANVDAETCSLGHRVGEVYYRCLVERLGGALSEVIRLASDPAITSALYQNKYLTIILNVHSAIGLVIGIVGAANPDGQACLDAQPQVAAAFAALQNTLLE